MQAKDYIAVWLLLLWYIITFNSPIFCFPQNSFLVNLTDFLVGILFSLSQKRVTFLKMSKL